MPHATTAARTPSADAVTSTNSAAPRLTVGGVGTRRAGSVLSAALGGAGPAPHTPLTLPTTYYV